MTVTKLINTNEIRKELIHFLRSNDVMTDATRGVTSSTTATTLSSTANWNLNASTLKNVSTLTINGTSMDYGTDYTYNGTGLITLTSATSGSSTATYDYGTDKIYPDFPRQDLTIGSYPRITAAITSMTTEENELGGVSNISDILISIYVYGTTMTMVDDYIATIRTKFLENKKNFYYLKFLTPVSQGPLVNEPGRSDKVLVRSLELRSILNVEVIS